MPGFSANAGDWCIPALRHLARRLAHTDEVRVLAVRYPYQAARYAVDDAEVIAIGGATSHRLDTLDVWRRTLGVLRAEHRRRPFDVLHAFWATESGLLASLAGRLLHVPSLVSLAGGELVALPDIGYGDQRLAWERLKIRASLRLASAVTVGSRYLARLAAGQVADQRLHLAPLGVDLDLFAHGHAPNGASPRLVHVGTLVAVKDQHTLLRAFAMLRDRAPSATLDIAGDGPLRTSLQELAADLGVQPALRWLGDVDHAALPSVYRAASTFVLSSRHEAQAMVAVEAAACGLTVVGTAVGVIPELSGGLPTVAPGDPRGLASAVAASVGTPGVPRAELRATFGLEACTDRFRRLYAGLACG